jgi:DNA-binding LacI/PurR family transcriptional regulator
MINEHDDALISKERLAGYSQALQKRNIVFLSELVYMGILLRKAGRMQCIKVFLTSDLMEL